jgi:hypothetical protein
MAEESLEGLEEPRVPDRGSGSRGLDPNLRIGMLEEIEEHVGALRPTNDGQDLGSRAERP